jgi:tetratricopeptide (TPR) repeat protein
MRLCWGTNAAIVLFGLWPLAGCHQLPGGKSVQDQRLHEQKSGTAPPQLTAAEIFQSNMAQADQLRLQHNLPQAIALCEKLREQGGPYAWQASWKIAQMCENDIENLDRAWDEYSRLLASNPGNADLITKLGDVSAKRGWWQLAAKHYADALKYQPGHVGARSGLALALAKTGDPYRSQREYAALLGPAEAYLAVAAVLHMDRNHRDALPYYQEALKHDPGLERAKQGLYSLQQYLAANPPAPVVANTRAPKGQKGTVDLEEAPTLVIEGNSRTVTAQPTLYALPPLELPRDNEREWKESGRKN